MHGLVDGSSVLWRLWAPGVDVGDRWESQVNGWEARIDHGIYAFSDVNGDWAVRARTASGRVLPDA
jgi:hypothetical protein